MRKTYDISKSITNELPLLTITEEITVTINNRHKTIINLQAMVRDAETKASEGKLVDESEFMQDSMKILIGDKALKEIIALDLPQPELQLIYDSILSIAKGESVGTPK